MLVSHEVPLSLLNESRNFNDYDYCLMHLYLKYKQYNDFFHNSVKMGRKVILDNSACELRNSNEGINFNAYVDIINELNPTEYIIPDEFNNFEKNVTFIEIWTKSYIKKIYTNKKIKSIGVVHGETFEKMLECYEILSKNEYVDKIAINFDEAPFNIPFTDNVSINKSLGRVKFILELMTKPYFNRNKKHHILGCHTPQEFNIYKNFNWIETIDTSNPIMAGIDLMKYNDGLLYKPISNIDKIFEIKLSEEQKDIILYNVNEFKKFIK